ncbi:hypothetical protein AK812_SmicGene16464 [Symbiodinium microadriaticum]|uniref:Endonuclease/exonuclease/phosphatase domain-containing protein n=1 Tax=Symbiodinium microadriaticum TaxID=2951 RepID=A0A1Q9E0A0_SYMMI|nr:hypothetical protein AK812_SmicGene16464 [Symbiodinium microadriaticum]
MTRAYHVCKKCGPSSWIFQDRVGANPFCQKCGCQWPKQQTPKHSAVSGAEWANRGDPNRVWKNKGPKRAGNAPVGAAQRALVSVWDALPGPAKQAIEQAGWQPRPLESPPGLGGKGNQSAAEVCRAPKGGAGKGRGAVKAAESGNDEGHAEAVKSLFASASEVQRGLLTQLGLQEPAEAPPDLAALCKQHINSLPPDIRKLVDETPEKPQTAQELMSEKSKKFKLATADLRDLIFKKSALQLRLNKHKELYTAMLEDMKSINEKLEDKQKAVSSMQIELQASVDVAQVPEALPEATEVLAKQIEAMEVEQLDECRQRLFEVVDEAVKRRRTEPPASTNPQPSPNPAGRGAGQHAAEDTGENRQADEPVALSGDVRGWMGGIFFKVEQVQVRACTYDQLPRHAPDVFLPDAFAESCNERISGMELLTLNLLYSCCAAAKMLSGVYGVPLNGKDIDVFPAVAVGKEETTIDVPTLLGLAKEKPLALDDQDPERPTLFDPAEREEEGEGFPSEGVDADGDEEMIQDDEGLGDYSPSLPPSDGEAQEVIDNEGDMEVDMSIDWLTSHLLERVFEGPELRASSSKVITANITSWRKDLCQWISQQKADVFMLQETHLSPERPDLIEAQLGFHGYNVFSIPAQPTGKGGTSGGLAICFRKHLNLRRVHQFVRDGAGFQVAALRLKDVDCYLVNVYLKSGEGFQGSHNAPILANLIAFLRSVKGLYFVAGDFNEDFEVIAATTLEQEAKGRWISSGESTCAGGGNIDFGLLAPVLAAGAHVLPQLVPFKPAQEMITVRPFLDAPVQERIYLRLNTLVEHHGIKQFLAARPFLDAPVQERIYLRLKTLVEHHGIKQFLAARVFRRWQSAEPGKFKSTWADIWAWLTVSQHPWKKVNGPMAALMAYLHELGVQAPQAQRWHKGDDTLTIDWASLDATRRVWRWLLPIWEHVRLQRISLYEGGQALGDGLDVTARKQYPWKSLWLRGLIPREARKQYPWKSLWLRGLIPREVLVITERPV